MVMLVSFLLICAIQPFSIVVHGKPADLSKLSSAQARLWNYMISRLSGDDENVYVTYYNQKEPFEFSIFSENFFEPDITRTAFKQEVNKRVSWLVYEDEQNNDIEASSYIACTGSLTGSRSFKEFAGLYVFTNNRTISATSVAIVSVTDTFQWFNGTDEIFLSEDSVLPSGTELTLNFDASIYYNSNTDLPKHNQFLTTTVQQAKFIIDEDRNNFKYFFSMKDLVCRQHTLILDDRIRVGNFACQATITFKCPLDPGSVCWLDEKPLTALQFEINPFEKFTSDKTISVRIQA